MSVESSSTGAALRGSVNGLHDDQDAEELDSVTSTSTARRGRGATSATKRKPTSSRTTTSRRSRGASPSSSPTPTPSVPVLQEEEEEDDEEDIETTPAAPLLHDSSRSLTPSDAEVEEEVEAVIATEDDDAPKSFPLPSERPSSNRNIRRIVLRRRLVSFLSSLGPIIRPLLIISSLILLLLLPSPSPPFAKHTYVDENALQPGQANVGWDWGQVALSDENSKLVEAVMDKGARARADFLVDRLADFGLQAHTQDYEFELPEPHSRTAAQNSELRHGSKTMRGVNTYARWKSGRSDGREAVVIAASWLSRWDGNNDPFADNAQDEAPSATTSPAQDGSTPSYVKEQRHRTNVRGISIALTLAKYLSHQMHWSKDIIFVFSDGYMEGMQAWSNAYFGVQQSNLQAEAVIGAGATIWNAISVDYPSDSFSSLVLLHQGKDGQLPNMDVLNTVVRIAERLGHITVKLPGSEHDRGEFSAQDDEDGGGWGTPGVWLEKRAGWGWRGVAKYKRAAKNIAQQMQVQTLCQPSGLHGLFQRFHVDAITVYAVPARGPYGFWQLGRIIEATMRSFSNLLERLHHSQFFYLLSSPEKFVQLGIYLPVALLLSIAMTLTGISKWMQEGSRAQERKIGFVDLVTNSGRDADEPLPMRSSSLRPDIALDNPTHLDLEMDLAVLVQQNEALVSTREKQQELLKLVTLLEAQGRPVVSALGLMGVTHFIGLMLFTLVSQAPLDCAADGLETCGALAKIAVASGVFPPVLALVITTVVKVKAAGQSKEMSSVLPPSAPRRILTLAHLLHSFAMLEAGLVVAVLSVLNFSAATAMAVLLIGPLYFLSLPVTGVQVDAMTNDQQHRDSLSPSPAANDNRSEAATDAHLATRSISLPWVAKVSLLSRLGCLSMAIITLLILLPWNAMWILHVSSMALDETASLPRLVDGLLWEWQILGTSFLPILFLVYTPIVMQGVVCGLLAAMA